MKRILTLTLALVMVLALTGCYRANMLDEDALSPAERGPDWGISLEAKDVTAKGMTLVIRQEGGAPTGELTTGDPYTLHRPEGNMWVEVPLIRDDIAWNTVAYLIPLGGELEQNLNWSWMYGELEAGKYMLTKQVMDFRGTGEYDTFTYGVEFTVE